MKFLAIILSVYVMWLTVMPCIDKPTDNSVHAVEICSQDQSNQHINDLDLCSPFCTCNCCQTNCDITSYMFPTPSMVLSINYFDHSSGFRSPFLFDFQVPPKA
jgi:hypothetical protein